MKLETFSGVLHLFDKDIKVEFDGDALRFEGITLTEAKKMIASQEGSALADVIPFKGAHDEHG